MENLSFYLINKNPEAFKSLFSSLKKSNLKVLSQTYVSIILFSALISLPIVILGWFFFTFNIVSSLTFGVLTSIGVFSLVYYYPTVMADSREKTIRHELVFAIVHMSTIAGSGAHPMKIFELIVDSKDYKELEQEFKKVLNYINLFGYSLSSALRAVSLDSPSPDLKEVLEGMASTIETGGDIKQYLSDKSKDSLLKFRLDQKKYVEKLAAYSEIYVGLLVAAPLLFIVTMAILEKISPMMMGFHISDIAKFGTFFLLPFVNVLFILFLEATKSEI
jgi:flagellar protein FlaJ